MDLFETTYRQDASVLLGSLSLVELATAFVLILLLIGLFFSIPKLAKLFEDYRKKKTKKKNQNVIQDLKMMKEIQTEIDEEMKQALIAKALREKE